MRTRSGEADVYQVMAVTPHKEAETPASLDVLGECRLDHDDGLVFAGSAVAETEKAVRQQLKRIVSGGQRLMICGKRERDMNGCLGLARGAGSSQE